MKVEVGKEGNVGLRYGDVDGAVRAFGALQGRTFAGRIIQANYVQESVFNAKFLWGIFYLYCEYGFGDCF